MKLLKGFFAAFLISFGTLTLFSLLERFLDGRVNDFVGIMVMLFVGIGICAVAVYVKSRQ